MRCVIRNAIKEDAESLANIIVESWISAYSNIIPKDEMDKFLVNKEDNNNLRNS